jgi:iron complex transport system ATP-binding protein
VSAHHHLVAEDLTLAYDRVEVARSLSLEIPPGEITCIVGANACGKSTLLRALARLLRPTSGAVLLDGRPIHERPTKEVALMLGILPQGPVAPEGILVADLVARGRYARQSWLPSWGAEHDLAVAEAMVAAGVVELADRPVDELSGGQRQRVWIALAMAQQTDILLLDEPTTYLDLAYQIEVLDLLTDINRRDGRTIVLVLHDLNQAARYSHRIVAMRSGAIVASGPPEEVITTDLVEHVFGMPCQVIVDPVAHTPLVIPISRHHPVGGHEPA